MKKRFPGYVFLIVILIFSAKNLFAQKQPDSNTPALNVLLIVADDQGMQMSGLCTPGVHTPALDSLVKNGTLFTRAYANYSSCSPSRASFLSSTFPHVNGAYHECMGVYRGQSTYFFNG